jgi:hypothetical protein
LSRNWVIEIGISSKKENLKMRRHEKERQLNYDKINEFFMQNFGIEDGYILLGPTKKYGNIEYQYMRKSDSSFCVELGSLLDKVMEFLEFQKYQYESSKNHKDSRVFNYVLSKK